MSDRALDALIAEKVMGMALITAAPADHPWFVEGTPFNVAPPHYSTDISAAWLVVDKLRGRGLYLQMNDTMSAYRARFFTVESTMQWDMQSGDGAYYTFAETAPLAICRAALRAMEDTP